MGTACPMGEGNKSDITISCKVPNPSTTFIHNTTKLWISLGAFELSPTKVWELNDWHEGWRLLSSPHFSAWLYSRLQAGSVTDRFKQKALLLLKTEILILWKLNQSLLYYPDASWNHCSYHHHHHHHHHHRSALRSRFFSFAEYDCGSQRSHSALVQSSPRLEKSPSKAIRLLRGRLGVSPG